MTAAKAVGDGAYGGLAEAPPDDTGRGASGSRLAAHADDRLRPLALRQVRSLAPAPDGARGPAALPAATSSTRPAAAATSASRRARTTRRSRCTPSGTWPASASARSSIRWSQLGFGKTSSTTPDAQTPRNLMGFKDGTRQHRGRPTRTSWTSTSGSGTRRRPGLDARRLLPGRPADPDAHRDLGPHLAAGAGGHLRPRPRARAPRSARHTRARQPFLDKRCRSTRTYGSRTRTPTDGATILRRGYSFTDGTRRPGPPGRGPVLPRLPAGPAARASSRSSAALAAKDALNEYIQHVGSAVFACPGGVSPGSFWGASLLA